MTVIFYTVRDERKRGASLGNGGGNGHETSPTTSHTIRTFDHDRVPSPLSFYRDGGTGAGFFSPQCRITGGPSNVCAPADLHSRSPFALAGVPRGRPDGRRRNDFSRTFNRAHGRVSDWRQRHHADVRVEKAYETIVA